MKKSVSIALALLLAGCNASFQMGGAESPPPATGANQPTSAVAAAAPLTPRPRSFVARHPAIIRPGAGTGTASGTTATSSGSGVITANTPFGSGTATDAAWLGQLYWLSAGTTKLPDFNTLQPSALLYTNKLDVASRAYTEGFAGVDANRNELFGIQYEGPVDVSTDGEYTLALVSDDGAKVWIDDTLILENDGIHGAQRVEQKVHLVKATHLLKVAYFNGAGNSVALQLFVKPNGVAESPLGPKL